MRGKEAHTKRRGPIQKNGEGGEINQKIFFLNGIIACLGLLSWLLSPLTTGGPLGVFPFPWAFFLWVIMQCPLEGVKLMGEPPPISSPLPMRQDDRASPRRLSHDQRMHQSLGRLWLPWPLLHLGLAMAAYAAFRPAVQGFNKAMHMRDRAS